MSCDLFIAHIGLLGFTSSSIVCEARSTGSTGKLDDGRESLVMAWSIVNAVHRTTHHALLASCSSVMQEDYPAL
jgi:hypothetical protein